MSLYLSSYGLLLIIADEVDEALMRILADSRACFFFSKDCIQEALRRKTDLQLLKCLLDL